MKSSFSSHGVSLGMSLLVALPERFNAAVERAVQKTVDQTVKLAQALAHVDSGAMRAGTYGVTSQKSGYEEAVDAALAMDLGTVILPEVGTPPPGAGTVSNATQQSIFEEFGTALHPPHPFLSPASMTGEGFFVTNVEDEVRRELD